MLKAAVTGTIGSGKSTASRWFLKQGYSVFDADRCAGTILEKNGRGYEEVLRSFKEPIQRKDGSIDHHALAAVVFQDEEKRKILNGITHPIIKEELLAFFHSHETEQIVFAEIPLLFQFGWEQYFDASIVVTCSEETAVKRLMKSRGYTQEEARSRLQAQMPAQQQIRRADYVVWNDGSKEEMEEKLQDILKRMKEKL